MSWISPRSWRGPDLVGVDVDVVGVEGVRHATGTVAPRYGRGPRAFGPAARLVGDEAVSLARPRAQQRARVARVDDLLDAEALGGAERRAHRVEPRLDLGPQRDRDPRPPRARAGRRPRARRRSAASPSRPTATRSGGSAARRRRARRRRRRRPCGPAPTPTARVAWWTANSARAPRRIVPARSASEPITKPGWSTRLTTGRRNWSQRSTKRTSLSDASPVRPPP